MLGVSGLLGSSGDGAASSAAAAATTSGPPEGGGGLELGGGGGSNSGGFSEDDKAAANRGEEGDRSSAGNRWPRQETLALLKIRSDMDVAFRDSSLKGPLWEEVSRKLAELGYQRSAKKCKEKFENVYKYHKRTKDGRASKPDAKTYRFFEQLEALDTHPIPNIPPSLAPPALPHPPPPLQPLQQQLHHHHHQQQQQQQPKSQPPAASAAAQPLMLPAATTPHPLQQHITVPSATANKPAANNTAASQNTSASAPTTVSAIIPSPLLPPPQHPRNPTNIPQPPSMMNPSSQPHSFRNPHASNSTSSSSSTSSDETLDGNDGGGGRKRKRKWKDFFERLMRDVIKKQEELQMRFLEAIEKRERDRLVREEAWRMQEMTRMNREHEILVKERSIAAAKDAALIAFLQKMSSDPHNPVQVPPVPEDAAAVALQVVSPPAQAQPQPPTQAQSQPQTPVAAAQQPQQPQPPTSPSNFGSIVRVNSNSMVAVAMGGGGGGGLEGANVTSPASSTSSSRWPKTEVQALIKLRTDLDVKYQESGPKGPLWEEISAGMRQLGYSRNAKRCKEKWENINKYFKKVKESNKKRPEDSKTCPYFHQLDALYREKTLMRGDGGSSSNPAPNPNYVPMLKSPPAVAVAVGQPTPSALPMMVRPEQQWPPLQPEDQRAPPEDIESENMEEPNPDDDMDEDGDDDDDDEDDEGGGYEIVTNKQKPAAGDS